LVLLFSEGVLNNNTSLNVRCHTSFSGSRDDTATVVLREVSFQNGQTEIAASSLADHIIPLAPLNEEN
jgi:hypothetical protein